MNISEEAKQEVFAILESGVLTSVYATGKHVIRLEQLLAQQRGYKYCTVMAGGTMNLLRRVIEFNGFQFLYSSILFVEELEKMEMLWCIYCNNRKTDLLIKRMRVHGYDFGKTYKNDFLGLGLRPTEIQACLAYNFYNMQGG